MSIFSTPLKGRIREADFDFLNSSFKEELSQGDFPVMTYRWVGKNKTILLAHGWESNSARWKLLINNLIDNANKYAHVTEPIYIHLQSHQNMIQLIVKDQGPGIAAMDKNKVFEKFYRVGAETTRTTKGSGLGLYFVKILWKKTEAKFGWRAN